MTTALSVITRAMRLIGIIDPEETPSDTQTTNGLEALNAMVHGWKAQSVDVGHEDWLIDDDVTVEIDPQHINGMTALLALTLQPEYPGSQVPQVVAAMAQTGWMGLQAAYFDSSVDSDLVVDTAFQRLASNRFRGWW